MNIQVGKWGNSLGVRIPGPIARDLGLHDGSEVDLQMVDGGLVLRPLKQPDEYSLDELLAQITPETLHGETEWGPASGNEAW